MANRSINKVTILGNLTRDPELKYTPSGTAVCTFSVATNRSWTTKEGQTREDVQYHRFVAWQKLAELCGKLLSKGKRVYCEGRITYREYTDKNDQQRHITEIVLDDFIIFYENAPSKKSIEEGEEIEEISSGEMDQDEKQTKSKTKEQKQESHDEDVNPEDIPF